MGKKINYQYVVDYFKNLGYPEHAAKGIAGNLGHESEFSTTAKNPTSKMKGLAQWDSRRRANLQKFAKSSNGNPDDPDIQLAFVEHELSSDYKGVKGKLMSSKDSNEASDVFGREYERFTPEGKQESSAEIEGRRYYSANGTRMPKGTTTPTTPTTSGSTVTFNPTSNNSKVEGLSQMANQGVIPERTVIEPMQKLGTVPLVEKKETPQTPEVVPVVSKVKAPPEKPSNLKKISELAMNTAPYLSNLYSATIKPPATPSPILNAPTSLQRVSMDVDRTQLESDYRDALRTSDLADVSTSVRAKLAAKAQKFNQMSKINETERNANLNISNKEREINTGIDMANRQALYNKQLQDVERENAMIAQRTANVANFSDKIIAQQARKDLQDLEVKKTEILANSDTFGNLKTYLEGIGGEKKAMGGKLYTAGRFMKTLKPIKTIK
jgi:hypothetical protein